MLGRNSTVGYILSPVLFQFFEQFMNWTSQLTNTELHGAHCTQPAARALRSVSSSSMTTLFIHCEDIYQVPVCASPHFLRMPPHCLTSKNTLKGTWFFEFNHSSDTVLINSVLCVCACRCACVSVCVSFYSLLHFWHPSIYFFSEINYSEARNITCYSMRISPEESSIHSLKLTHLRSATFLKLEIEYSWKVLLTP